MAGIDEVTPVSQCLIQNHFNRKQVNNALGGAHLQRPLPLLPLSAPLGNPTIPQGAVQPTAHFENH
jgi:hypothetical protein